MQDNTTFPPDFIACAQFHGHACPGLAMGYRATLAGMQALGAGRSADEELIAIVENDSCAVDAVQSLASCTYGKGNLFLRDHGKQVYTFARRDSRRAVRIALKSSRGRGHAGEMSREERMAWLLSAPADEILDVREVAIELPQEAGIHQSVPCEACGEAAMATRIREVGGRKLCIPCADGPEH